MRVFPILAVASILGIAIAAKADSLDRGDLPRIHTAIRQADRRGDFEDAVNAAEECVMETLIMEPSSNSLPFDYECAHYLSSALRRGRGAARDETRAFVLLKELATEYPDDDAALDLAEAYLDGSGTFRDPVEAAVVFWRVRHGAWSLYSDYWGMCDDCKAFWTRENEVGARINHQLTTAETRRADAIAAARFPEIAVRVSHRDRQIEGAIAMSVVVASSLILWGARSIRRQARKGA